MDLSVIAFLGLLVAVALLRIVELQISRRHQQEMIARGAAKVEEPRFRWMVLLHTAVLIGAALEVVLLRRPFIPILAAIMFVIFLAAEVLRPKQLLQAHHGGAASRRLLDTGNCLVEIRRRVGHTTHLDESEAKVSRVHRDRDSSRAPRRLPGV